MRRILALAVALVGLVAASAPAATVTVVDVENRYDEVVAHRVVVAAAAGERNDMTLAIDSDGLRVTDAGAPPTAGSGCRKDGDAVACRLPYPVISGRVELGDGDDRFSDSAQLILDVDGGAGADHLTGDHRVHDADDDPDVIERPLSLSFAGRASAISVDLARGSTSLGDRLVRVRRVVGTRYDDDLRGSGGGEVLIGGPGDDRLFGRGGGDELWGDLLPPPAEPVPLGPAGEDRLAGGDGDDLLDGGGRSDVLRAGRGDDTIAPGEERLRHVDHVACGAGRDALREVDLGDRAGRDCEWLVASEFPPFRTFVRTTQEQRIRISLGCRSGCPFRIDLRRVDPSTPDRRLSGAGRRPRGSRLASVRPVRSASRATAVLTLPAKTRGLILYLRTRLGTQAIPLDLIRR